MDIKKVEEIREAYRERALDRDNPNEKIIKIWNVSVDASACYMLFNGNPIKNIKYKFRLDKKMKELKQLMEGENF